MSPVSADHQRELAMLIDSLPHDDLAEILRLIARRLERSVDVHDFDVEPRTDPQTPQPVVADRRQLQALIHQAYQEAGFVVTDIPDGTVGIINAGPQIVRVTNRIIELLTARFLPAMG